ncbi:MAG: metal-dependent transcriptional regulator [Planctomycetota bacterium]|nr:MAG: metal-dependent transcriptional regulator [Planctomycetota bacterium]
MASLTVENYVKTIHQIAAREAGTDGRSVVSTGQIAKEMGVSPGTVTGMIKTLTEAGLTTHTPYEGVRLTEPGLRLALKVIRRHRLLETFLVRTLNMPWDEVHEEAEHMEHAVSDRLIDRLDDYLNLPVVDPHGDPIPRADGTVPAVLGYPLKDMVALNSFRVVRVIDQDPKFLRYLTDCGVILGAMGKVIENRPEAGVVLFEIDGNRQMLGQEAAGRVIVDLVPAAT